MDAAVVGQPRTQCDCYIDSFSRCQSRRARLMPALKFDPFAARDTFNTGSGQAGIYRLSKLEDAGLGSVSQLPVSIRVLLEAVLRNCDGFAVSEDDVKALTA